MFLVGITSWWYGKGLRLQLDMVGWRIARTNDYFSIKLLLATLFSPYRQISAGRVEGSLSDRMHAFADRLISRVIGAIVRSFMILFGFIAISLQVIVGLIILVVWLSIPLFPIFGVIPMMIGWVPSWT
jgi:hypothetical protein